MPSPKTRARASRRPEANPPDPNLAVPVEVLDAHGVPLVVMPMLQAAAQGLCFRKAVTALFAGDRLFVRKVMPTPARRENRREVFDLFVTPVPVDLAPEDVAARGPAELLGYEPAIRLLAEVPPQAGFPVRLSLFVTNLAPGGLALLAGKNLSSFDADELHGLTAQSPELFSQDLLRILGAGVLFPKP